MFLLDAQALKHVVLERKYSFIFIYEYIDLSKLI
jgi:hypothetical protein